MRCTVPDDHILIGHRPLVVRAGTDGKRTA
jgi:hypothetical protein